MVYIRNPLANFQVITRINETLVNENIQLYKISLLDTSLRNCYCIFSAVTKHQYMKSCLLMQRHSVHLMVHRSNYRQMLVLMPPLTHMVTVEVKATKCCSITSTTELHFTFTTNVKN